MKHRMAGLATLFLAATAVVPAGWLAFILFSVMPNADQVGETRMLAEHVFPGLKLLFLAPPLLFLIFYVGCVKAFAIATGKASQPSPDSWPDGSKTVGAILILAVLAWFLPGIMTATISRRAQALKPHLGEGPTKGNLGAIRSVLSIYYGDAQGSYPETLEALTMGGKYLTAIPMSKPGYQHQDSSAVRYGKISNDSGGWLYNNIPGDENIGKVMVNCTHTDTRGTAWSSY